MTALASECIEIGPARYPAEGKESKRYRKLVKDRHRPMDPREQGRNLWEVVNQARRLIELADHKARYALVVMGVVNAGVFVLATRSSHFASLVPVHVQPLLSFLVIPFGLMALVFLVDAYNALRPRPPHLPSPSDGHGPPVGLIFWDVLLTHSVSHYQQAWETVHRGQLNDELAAMAHSLAHAVQSKYRVLHRLYIELLIIILLASLILAIPMIAGALANGPAFIPSP